MFTGFAAAEGQVRELPHAVASGGLPEAGKSANVASMSNISSIGGGGNALQNAQLGISRGMANMARDEQVVAGGSGGSSGGIDSMTNALVDANQQALNVEASARAFSIVNKTLGTLIDVKA